MLPGIVSLVRPNCAQKRGRHHEIPEAQRFSIPNLPVGDHPDGLVSGPLASRRKASPHMVPSGPRLWRQSPRHPRFHSPQMGLAEARQAARDLLARFDLGAPAPAPAVHPRSVVTLTLGGLLDRYEHMRQREGHRVKRLPLAMRTLRNGLKPYLALPVSEFSKHDLRAARDRIIERGKPFQANRGGRLSLPRAGLGLERGPRRDQLRARPAQVSRTSA